MPDVYRVFDNDGNLIHEEPIDLPPAPADPFLQLQAQVDALTDIVLGGGA